MTSVVVGRADVLTAKDVAGLLKVSVRQVQTMAKESDLPSFRVGRQWRFLRGVIVEWMMRPASSISVPAAPAGNSPIATSTASGYENLLAHKTKPQPRGCSQTA